MSGISKTTSNGLYALLGFAVVSAGAAVGVYHIAQSGLSTVGKAFASAGALIAPVGGIVYGVITPFKCDTSQDLD